MIGPQHGESRRVPPMTSRQRVLAALRRESVDRAPVVNPTSIATVGLMELAEAPFPGAHRNPELMAALAATGHTVLGYDSVMPVFSIIQESSALGCGIEWGQKDNWPSVEHPPIWRTSKDIVIPDDLLDHPDVRCVVDAIRLLRRRFGDEVAIIGKAIGPWTLCYNLFGLEPFLLMSMDDPGETSECLRRLKVVTVEFGLAQIEAGADALTIADHATGALVSAEYYRRFLQAIHAEFAKGLPAPIILHICGPTLDRMAYIAETGVAAFHFDSKNSPRDAMAAVDGRIALVGNVNNTVTLLTGGPAEVRAEVEGLLAAGVGMIGPECAVPPQTAIRNLQEIPRTVSDWFRRREAGAAEVAAD